MELKIKEEKENPLFNRREFQFEVQAKITPSRTEVGKSISKKLSTNLENIEIKKIEGKFGSNSFGVNAFVYDSKEDRMSTESKPKLIAEEKTEEVKENKEDKKSQEVQKNEEAIKPQETEEKSTENKNG